MCGEDADKEGIRRRRERLSPVVASALNKIATTGLRVSVHTGCVTLFMFVYQRVVIDGWTDGERRKKERKKPRNMLPPPLSYYGDSRSINFKDW